MYIYFTNSLCLKIDKLGQIELNILNPRINVTDMCASTQKYAHNINNS